jgi:hypothetical protein
MSKQLINVTMINNLILLSATYILYIASQVSENVCGNCLKSTVQCIFLISLFCYTSQIFLQHLIGMRVNTDKTQDKYTML